MTEIAHLSRDAALQAVREMIVAHLMAMDEDPRQTTLEKLIDELSEALHWEAQDADTEVDAELDESHTLICQVLAEYCQAKGAMQSGTEGVEELVATYRDLEVAAEACFSSG